jgi:hypothetical protein
MGGGDDEPLPPGSTEPKTLDGQDAGDVGDYVSIAVAGTDVHVAYVDRASGKLKYVRSTGGTFGTPVVVDAAADEIVQDTAIAVAANGDVHILYHDAKAVDLRHVRASGGAFGKAVIVDGQTHQSGTGLRLAVDPSGGMHALYFDYDAIAFKLAKATGGTFAAGTPVPEIIGGSGPAIAVDGSGALVVSARDEIYGLSYMKRTGTTFGQPTYVDPGEVGELSAIAVGSDGKIHIAYTDQINFKLKYVSGTGTTFSMPTVADGVGGVYPRMALDAAGAAHVVHHDLTGSRIRYTRIGMDGNSESKVVEDVAADAISAVTTDAGGNVHIAYRQLAGTGRGMLKYVAIAKASQQ